MPGTQGDTLKVVQNLPGVARPAFNGGQLVIRGTSPNDSGVFLDGQRIPLLYHFGGLTSVYNSELLDVGGLPARQLLLLLRQRHRWRHQRAQPRPAHGPLPWHRGHRPASSPTPCSRAPSPRTSASPWRAGAPMSIWCSSSVPENEDGPSIQVAPRYYDAQLKLHWTPSKQHTFTLQGLISNDTLGLLFDRPADQDPSVNGDFEVTTGFNQLRLGHQYKGGALHPGQPGPGGQHPASSSSWAIATCASPRWTSICAPPPSTP